MSNIINFDKVDLTKNILLTGKHSDIQQSCIVVNELKEYSFYLLPEAHIHYTEYKDIISDFIKNHHNEKVIISSQNSDFISALLESDLDFQSLTIRHNKQPENYALRVVDKNKAKELVNDLGMDLR